MPMSKRAERTQTTARNGVALPSMPYRLGTRDRANVAMLLSAAAGGDFQANEQFQLDQTLRPEPVVSERGSSV